MKASESFASRGAFKVTDIHWSDVGLTAGAAEDPGFAALGLKPDMFKAYVGFKICHTLPATLGPVQSGNILGFQAPSMAASHGSLLHQQLNLRHLLRIDDGPGNPVTRDRIIGAIVATSFPKPMGGYKPGESHPITAHAVLFKVAEGVPKLLGEHLSGRETQSVSIETNTNFGNIGVHRPSTGELHPILEAPREWQGAFEEVKGKLMPHVGEVKGEQLVVIYGMNGNPVDMRGVGVTPNPAERQAKIIGLTAESDTRRFEDCTEETRFSISAEAEFGGLLGQKVGFKSGRAGTVYEIALEGKVRVPGGVCMSAQRNDPVLKIRLPDGYTILRSFSQLMDAAASATS